MKKKIRQFIKHEAFTGFTLLLATIVALMISNSAWQSSYLQLLQMPFGFHLSEFSFSKPIMLWVNDGLMAIFFFYIGLEIKREFCGGELGSRHAVMLPSFGALGGVLVPVLLFIVCTASDPAALKGWAIPAATDIAFSLGLLSLLGRRVPVALKVFLVALAVMDDISAILIISVWYTDTLNLVYLFAVLAMVVLLVQMNRAGSRWASGYLLGGVVLWWCCYHAGIHPTISGVILAFTIPHQSHGSSLLCAFEHDVAPWVKYLVMPIFALCNAGVPIAWQDFTGVWQSYQHLVLGVFLGLVVGKQVGIVMMVWIANRGWKIPLPTGCSYWHIYGVACLCGVGFTMSLFIGALSVDPSQKNMEIAIRMSVLLSSLVAGLWGLVVLRYLAPRPR